MFAKNKDRELFRVLGTDGENILAVSCIKQMMPKVYKSDMLKMCDDALPFYSPDIETLSPKDRKTAIERYTAIAGVLPVIGDKQQRNKMIRQNAELFGLSTQTIKSYLWIYLVHQNIGALAPAQKKERPLTQDEKNIRWALNKFFYTRHKNSLSTSYMLMLKEKYTDENGVLVTEYPSFNQFRYFYTKTKKLENYYISRDGLTDYQRNHRPLTGAGVQQFSQGIGTAMLDSTICDIFLADEDKYFRPVLIAAVDAETGLCLGYNLCLTSSTDSLVGLMNNIITDKIELCRRMGIDIKPEQWPVQDELPGIMLTDGGREYTSHQFSQIAELGVRVIKADAFRPDLKGVVEKFFDIIQKYYKDMLKGKGVIIEKKPNPYYDYKKEACLTMADFEKIIVRCIVYYNSERVVQSYPYTQQMIDAKVKPHSCDLWEYLYNKPGNTMLKVESEALRIVLLPRIDARFTRTGLIANGLRYYTKGYKEQYLRGGNAVVAYDPKDCSAVWLIEKDGRRIPFNLIEKTYAGLSLSQSKSIKDERKKLVTEAMKNSTQSRIDLIEYISTIATKGD